MTKIEWQAPDYLRGGNARQQAAYAALQAINLYATLAAYTPVLIGTIPIAVDTPHSDLDVSLYAPDLSACAAHIRQHYGHYAAFDDHIKRRSNGLSYVAHFEAHDFVIECFAMAQPITAQHGYRHMVIEARLLQLGGETLRQQVRQLKLRGIKTEAAFAQILGLAGDPYAAILALESHDDAALCALLQSAPDDHRPNS